ncbi:MAG: CBS domain-containing protein [Nitrospirae bacterium]|nr:CBS domain-containing protein [Nitrospirota bacterium]MCL5420900.1 CBS domain-containing protein [Nitrospirota bacterium]
MLKARDIMTKDVITVSPDATVEELGRLFIEKQISGAPVVDASGKLFGVVTENDLISKNSRLHIPTVLRLFDAFIPLGTSKLEEEIRRMTASTVGEVCVKKVVTINEETPIDEIATIMNEKKIHLLPVVKEGRVVGIIGKKDLIRGIAGETPE